MFKTETQILADRLFESDGRLTPSGALDLANVAMQYFNELRGLAEDEGEEMRRTR